MRNTSVLLVVPIHTSLRQRREQNRQIPLSDNSLDCGICSLKDMHGFYKIAPVHRRIRGEVYGDSQSF